MNINDKIELMKQLGNTSRKLMPPRDERGPNRLGRGQLGMLDVIIDNPGISQEELANELDLDKTTIAKAVKKMEMHKLIERKKSEADARKLEIYALDTANEIKDRMNAQREERTNLALENIDDEELKSFKGTLSKIEGNIEKNSLDMRNRRFDSIKKVLDTISANPGTTKEELESSIQFPADHLERVLGGLAKRGLVEIKDGGYHATQKASNFDKDNMRGRGKGHPQRRHPHPMHHPKRFGKGRPDAE